MTHTARQVRREDAIGAPPARPTLVPAERYYSAGFAALDPHPLIITLAGGAAVFFCIQAVQEERHCLARMGAEYDAYRRRVPRFNAVLGLFRLSARRRKDIS